MKLNQIFTDYCVFAANKPIRIYGEGSGLIEVSFHGCNAQITAENNHWLVELPPMEYGGPYSLVIKGEGKEITRKDIYIGDVYLFAGQSNVQMKMTMCNFPAKAYTDNEKLRLFTVDRMEDGEIHHTSDGWVVCEKEDIINWSALGYLVGAEITHKKNIAVGIIACYQGASVIQSWIPDGIVEDKIKTLSDEEKHHDHKAYPLWNRNGVLYENQFQKVVPYSITGVLWYQGESNTSLAESAIYGQMLHLLIETWRKDLQCQELPFVVVSLADLEDETINKKAWNTVQMAQKEISRILPYVASVTAADVCETNDIHPPTKDKLACKIADSFIY